MRKKTNFEKTIKNLIAKVDEHIGSNGDTAHLPADLDRAGFMTPDHVKELSAVEKTVVLWKGGAADPDTVIQLADDFSKFGKLRITVDNMNKNQAVVDYVPLNGWVGIDSTNIFDGQVDIFSLFKLTLFFEGKTAKITLNHRIDSTSNANTPVNDGLMQVVKIEGVL